MPKFFVANEQIQEGIIYIKGEDVNHIANVLRLKKEDEILVCNKDTSITYNTKITQLQKDMVTCKVIQEIQTDVESNIKVTIFQGLPKSDKMEYIIQKTTELGVSEITPIKMRRCVVKLEGKDEIKKLQRWQKVAEVAAKQSGRNIIPKIEQIIDISKLITLIDDFDYMIVAYEEEKEVTLKQVLQEIKPSSSMELKIGIVIGPEGGLDQKEVELLKEKGAKLVSLGNRILRTETAPLAMLSNIMYEFEG